MNLKNCLKQSSGFSFIETLSGAVIIGLISLVIFNQLEMVKNARIKSSSSSVINTLKNKIITTLADEKTCTANFGGATMATTSYNKIKDSENIDIINLTTSYGRSVGGNIASDNSNDLVKITSISTVMNPANADEMNLTVKFSKKSGKAGLFSSNEEFTFPLTMVKSASSTLSYCFSDATLSIATAIRLSCKGNSSFYNEHANLPYGQCEHSVQPLLPACPTGKFIHKIGINLSHLDVNDTTVNSKAIEYECAALESTCPPDMVITNTNANGTVTCGYPLPNCAPGQMMVMSSGGNYICLNSDVGCTGLYAVKSFLSNGTFNCQQFYPPKTCAGFVTSISPGSVSCGANVTAKTCPIGQFISQIDSSGTPICTPWVTLPYSCPPGQAAAGINSSGDLACQPMDRRTSCAGTMSTARTFKECLAAGGSVNDRYVTGSTNAYCVFNIPATTTPTCPAGWNSCSNLRTTINHSCNDTNSACAYSVRPTQTAPGTYAFYSNTPTNTTCYAWMRNSGPWVMSCTPVALPVTTAYTTQLGCY